MEKYRLGMAPLLQAGRLRAVLVQLAASFKRTRENRLYLARLLDALKDLPAAVEFRHRSWADDKVLAKLEKRRVALVTVDVPQLSYLFPTQTIVTRPELFYIRFHGRTPRAGVRAPCKSSSTMTTATRSCSRGASS